MKRFVGTVMSDKMEKTVIVEVRTTWTHPVYKKTVSKTKRYSVHDEMGSKVGDRVSFVEAKPISKNKRFRLEKVLKKSGLEKS
jgi:small subunit ribosomal protein S17